jgi:hypothetical protein
MQQALLTTRNCNVAIARPGRSCCGRLRPRGTCNLAYQIREYMSGKHLSLGCHVGIVATVQDDSLKMRRE